MSGAKKTVPESVPVSSSEAAEVAAASARAAARAAVEAAEFAEREALRARALANGTARESCAKRKGVKEKKARRMWTLEQKIDAVTKLGHLGGGQFGKAGVDDDGKPWTLRSLSRSLGASPGTLSLWKTSAKQLDDEFKLRGKEGASRGKLRAGKFDVVGQALYDHWKSIESDAARTALLSLGPLQAKALLIAKEMAKALEDKASAASATSADDTCAVFAGDREVQGPKQAPARVPLSPAELRSFKASEGWITHWKAKYGCQSAQLAAKNG